MPTTNADRGVPINRDTNDGPYTYFRNFEFQTANGTVTFQVWVGKDGVTIVNIDGSSFSFVGIPMAIWLEVNTFIHQSILLIKSRPAMRETEDRPKAAPTAASGTPPPPPVAYPLRVRYHHRCVEWDEKSLPYIEDASGQSICVMTQRVGHPGLVDSELGQLAQLFVAAANAAWQFGASTGRV